MSFKISIPNKSKINPPLMKSDLHGPKEAGVLQTVHCGAAGHKVVHPKGGCSEVNGEVVDRFAVHGSPSGIKAPLPSDINGTLSDKIRRPSNLDGLKSNDNIQRPSGMKSGESIIRVEKDIFSKKPSFLYTSTLCSDRSPSGMGLGTAALQVENDIFLKKPSFLYANSKLQMGVEKDIFSNKPSFLYTASEAKNFICERKETIDSLDNAHSRTIAGLSEVDRRVAGVYDVDESEVTASRPLEVTASRPLEVTAPRPPPLIVTSLAAPNTKDNERKYSTFNIEKFLKNCDYIK